MNDHIIVSDTGPDGSLLVWNPTHGWTVVRKLYFASDIGWAHRYKTAAAARQAIKRGQKRSPSRFWREATVTTLTEARKDDNPFGLVWKHPEPAF